MFFRGARLTWRRQEKPGNASSLRNNYFNTEFTTNTQIRAGPTNSSCSKPDVNAAPSPATAAPVCTHKVRFNGSQLSAIPAAAAGPVPLPSTALSTAPTTSGNSNSSATNKKVSFNGANIVLEQITLPVPPPRPVPARSSTGLPIPKVSVSTASGEKLRPPPRVVVAAGDSTDTVATDYEGGDNGGEVEVPPAITAEVGQNAGNAERAETGDEKEFSSVGEGVGRIDVSSAHLGSAEEEEEEEEGRQWTVGSFQMSEDGTAMLFSTG